MSTTPHRVWNRARRFRRRSRRAAVTISNKTWSRTKRPSRVRSSRKNERCESRRSDGRRPSEREGRHDVRADHAADERVGLRCGAAHEGPGHRRRDRKSTRLNSSHTVISYAVFCLKKKKKQK